ncbi:hypothetical protein H312_02532 [Anncaliia algerae PRA339]|uniref:Uncharacterized protein n=1 Tax=Anncaliia algerae PRA339 TaxID=1288291 RepID=A0A059EZF6_9MICR|nr:hypothetical protein H312_02532 [Anncaliia algerae PRA339]
MISENKEDEELVYILNNKILPINEITSLLAQKNINIKIKMGSFNSKEIKEIDIHVKEYLRIHSYTLEELQVSIQNYDKKFPLAHLSRYVTERIRYRTFFMIYSFIQYNYHPAKNAPFTNENRIRLMELVKEKNYNWKLISKEMLVSNKYLRNEYMRFLEDKVSKPRILKVCQYYKIDLTEKEIDSLTDGTLRKAKSFIERKTSSIFQWDKSSIYQLCYAIFCNNYYATQEAFNLLGSNLNEESISVEEKIEEEPILLDDFDFLNEEIVLEDIFWGSLRLEFKLPRTVLKSRFKIIVNYNRITTYEHLLTFLMKSGKEILIENKKNKMIMELRKENKNIKNIKESFVDDF